jgi:hypothetical protein
MTDVAYTEDEIALEFAAKYAGEIAFVVNSGRTIAQHWHLKIGDGWEADRLLWVQWLIRQFAADIRRRCGDPEIVARLSSRITFTNIEMLLRCDPRLVRTREELGFPVKAKSKKEK